MLSGLFVALNVHIFCRFMLDNVSQYVFLSPLIFCKLFNCSPSFSKEMLSL